MHLSPRLKALGFVTLLLLQISYKLFLKQIFGDTQLVSVVKCLILGRNLSFWGEIFKQKLHKLVKILVFQTKDSIDNNK